MERQGPLQRPNGKRVTMEDVAAAANVSGATVSRALNGLPNVTPATRNMVIEAARQLGYLPDPHAARLAAGKSGTVGIVVPVLDQWFYAKASASIEETLSVHGFDLLRFTLASSTSGREELFERHLSPKRLDGIITVSLPLSQAELRTLSERDQKVVTVNAVHGGAPSVTIDDYAATRVGVQHLINLGHRRIGHITALIDDPIGFSQTPVRLQGFTDALTEAGLEPDEALILPGNETAQGGADAMAMMLATPRPPTAVFAASDEMAIGAAKSVRDLGLRVPEEVSIVGFDDHDLSKFFGLTTLRQDVAHLGATAARMLESWISTGVVPDSAVLPTQLVVRDTTAPARTTPS